MRRRENKNTGAGSVSALRTRSTRRRRRRRAKIRVRARIVPQGRSRIAAVTLPVRGTSSPFRELQTAYTCTRCFTIDGPAVNGRYVMTRDYSSPYLVTVTPFGSNRLRIPYNVVVVVHAQYIIIGYMYHTRSSVLFAENRHLRARH